MSTDQFEKAKDLRDKIYALKNYLDKINSDLKQISDKYSYEKYSLQGTCLTLYKGDVLILLGQKKTYVENEIAFLEKQFKSI